MGMWRGASAALFLTALATLSAQAPPPPPPPNTAAPARPVTTVLVGRVIDALTRQPIPNAHLATGPNVVGAPVVLADSEGRFSLPAPSGRFVVVATVPVVHSQWEWLSAPSSRFGRSLRSHSRCGDEPRGAGVASCGRSRARGSERDLSPIRTAETVLSTSVDRTLITTGVVEDLSYQDEMCAWLRL